MSLLQVTKEIITHYIQKLLENCVTELRNFDTCNWLLPIPVYNICIMYMYISCKLASVNENFFFSYFHIEYSLSSKFINKNKHCLSLHHHILLICLINVYKFIWRHLLRYFRFSSVKIKIERNVGRGDVSRTINRILAHGLSVYITNGKWKIHYYYQSKHVTQK